MTRVCHGFVAALLVLTIIGCHAAPKSTYSTERPSLHSVTTGHFVIHSDTKLSPGDSLVRELESLHSRVTGTLQLPAMRDPVNVYIFSDEPSYRFYMNTTWKDLPPRRAYFVGTTRELAVYSFLSPQVLEDLRHECTHGILHATLQTVPLWLDEGLAEYFEIESSVPEAAHAIHLEEIRRAETEDWKPNLYQLEMLSDFRDLTNRDYAESWAWVHFMLNSDDAASEVLLQYIAGLRETRTPQRLLPVLEKAVPGYYADLQAHTRKLQPTQSIAAFQ